MNVPNVITGLRTLAAIGLAVASISAGSRSLVVAAYLCYWLGDMLDGLSARWLGQETRVGAVFDIVADRACASLCAAALLALRPYLALPVGVFLVQFTLVDCLLSLSFLRWPILGPNYFGTIDRTVYRWNWSPPAKAVNSGGLILLAVFAPTLWWPTSLALAVLVIKVLSLKAVAAR
jgi:CDP-diacylglycerol--glycerol-3-phosphate 3-phosphatidyltransferase